MSQRINTGNYRICRDKPGVAKSKEILFEGSLEKVNDKWGNLEKSSTYQYYKEEEVIYRGTLFDEHKRPIDSAPTWVRSN